MRNFLDRSRTEKISSAGSCTRVFAFLGLDVRDRLQQTRHASFNYSMIEAKQTRKELGALDRQERQMLPCQASHLSLKELKTGNGKQ